jgi:hypothetical protein
MCRGKDIKIFSCHIDWLLYGFLCALPSILGILILNWILKKIKIFIFKISIRIITVVPILTMVFMDYLFVVRYIDLTIYSPDKIGYWHLFRDYTLKPLIPTLIIYLVLFVLLKRSENKKLQKKNKSDKL